jgi:tRNA dimethylallyltransferase
MFELGLVAEVEALKRRGDLSLQNPSVRTVGYRQIWEYLTGQVDCYEMVQRGIVATRQFAKRQLTWLRHYQGVTSFDSEREGLIRQCKDFVRRQTAL